MFCSHAHLSHFLVYRVTQKSVNVKHSLVLKRTLGELYALNREYLISNKFLKFRKVTTFLTYSSARIFFPPLWLYRPIQTLAASMKLSVSLQLLDLGQSVGLLGRVISSSQGLYLYTNTEKRTHNTNTKHPCPEWDSNSRSRRPRERRQFMP
jgi:hypothetical protein